MAAKLRLSLVLCVLAIWAVDFAFAHDASSHNAPAPSVDCSSLILSNLVDCLSFVSDGSTTTKPEGNCCAGLKTVVKTDADCICEGFKSSASLGVPLNITKAMTLPAACNVSLPDSAFSNCALSPAAAAAPGPVAAAPGTGTGGNGAASAPAPSLGGSGSSVLTISFGSLLVGLVVASFSSF